ncbi:MAG: HTH-type transcriptional repressor YtrA [Firmicutes bacterium]|nr:HTH-type transcriptional repressor YtrA [candidate division NPL-UPA2 bacterium]
MVALELRKKSGVPLYVQLKTSIRQQAESGAWSPGFKLPTERELSTLLSVSRNTVSQAYRELEQEGILVSLQGKGTFLAKTDASSLSASRSNRLETLVSHALGQALDEGFDCEEFREAAARMALQRQRMLSEVRMVFVECNREQVDYFSTHLGLGSGVSASPLLLDELLAATLGTQQLVLDAEIVVTTFFHESDVRAAIGPDKLLLAVALEPELETMVRIARIPRQRRLALVCISEVFAEKVQTSLNAAGMEHRLSVLPFRDDSRRLPQVLEDCDVVLVSPGRKREVLQLCPTSKEVIEFVYRPDIGSSNLLQNTILQRRKGMGKSV